MFGAVNSDGRIECEMITRTKDGETVGSTPFTLPVKYQRVTDTKTSQRREEVLSLFADMDEAKLEAISQAVTHNHILMTELPLDFRQQMRDDMQKDMSKFPRQIDDTEP